MFSRLYRPISVALLLLSSLLLSACANFVTSEVTAFHQWTNEGPLTYAFIRTANQRNSPEHAAYEDLVMADLGPLGFSQVDAAQARYLVSLDYGVEARKVRIREPIYAGPAWGPYNRGWYSPFYGGYRGYPGPWAWAPFPEYVDTVQTRFRHHFQLEITEAQGGRKRYQVTALHDSYTSNLARVMPILVQSALKNFPGENGKPQLVNIEVAP